MVHDALPAGGGIGNVLVLLSFVGGREQVGHRFLHDRGEPARLCLVLRNPAQRSTSPGLRGCSPAERQARPGRCSPMSQRSIVARLAEEKGLVIVSPDALTLRRQRCGKGFSFLTKTGALVRDDGEIKRLKALAVPPAYVNVRFAADEAAHLQAVGEDAAGRLQYRYHPKWAEVREVLKARRLAGLVKVVAGDPSRGRPMPVRRKRSIGASSPRRCRTGQPHGDSRRRRGVCPRARHARRHDPVEVERQARRQGHRDAVVQGQGRQDHHQGSEERALPCRHGASSRTAGSAPVPVPRGRHGAAGACAREVNAFLQEIAGRRISLKDFRTLVASAAALKALAATDPADSERQAPAPGARGGGRDRRGTRQHAHGVPHLVCA